MAAKKEVGFRWLFQVWNPGGKAAAEVGIEPNIAGITNGEPNETR